MRRLRRMSAAKRAPAASVGRGLTDPAALIDEGIRIAGRPISAGRFRALLERMIAATAPTRARTPWIAIPGRAVLLRVSLGGERERDRNE
jgi:hypothetical protein